jgi:hypothetical protein
MRKIILVVAVMTFTPAHAQIATMGAHSCGQWVAVSAENSVETLNARNWLIGYMSGIAIGSGRNILNGVDPETIYEWMDNYCRENPSSNTANGGTDLYFQL